MISEMVGQMVVKYSMSVFVRQNGSQCEFTTSESWSILSPMEQKIKSKIERVGVPLKEWKIEIYRGVLTGFNDAFVIDGKTKDALITSDPKSAEIIRPILRGRDIKRFYLQFADQWIISTFPSLQVNIDDYPAVKQHLLAFGYDRLKQTGETGSRKRTNNQWFETQDSISYWDDFSKQKIIWIELTDRANFCLDEEGYYLNNTVFFLIGDRLPYLLAFLNSSLCEWYFDKIAATSGVGTRRWIKQYIEQIRIPIAPPMEMEQELSLLVKQIQTKRKKGLKALDLERKVDEIVFSLFDLEPEEVHHIKSHIYEFQALDTGNLVIGQVE